jgi:formylglycine-generating enzyme required for sulfatase activity
MMRGASQAVIQESARAVPGGLRRAQALRPVRWDTEPVIEPFAANLRRLAPAFVLMAAAACGGRTSGTNQATACTYNHALHANGTTWTCSDGCNTCSCSNGKIVSTLLACLSPEAGALADAGLDATTGVDGEASDDVTGALEVATTDANDSALETGGDAEPEAGVDAALPPSCAPGGPGMTNCGPGGSGTESCCTSLEVTGGTFYRMYSNDNIGPTLEAHPATVSGFRMDKYLVTVGRFRQFVDAWNGGAGYKPPVGSGKHTYLNGGLGLVNVGPGVGYEPGWLATNDNNIAPTNANLACGSPYDTWTNSAGSQENLPINCVNWYESYAFCIWDGGFLPSEAEWAYAAAGGSQQREYPWGSTDPGTVCPGTGCQYAIYNCDYPNGSGNCTGVTNIAPVGTATLGAGLWGQLDLAGDVFEWNLDGLFALYFDPCTDCADFAGAPMARGGGFGGNAYNFLPPFQITLPPTNREEFVGFRCARSAL